MVISSESDAPVVPYRKIADGEKALAYKHVEKELKNDEDMALAFWKQTIREGRRVAKLIRDEGFIVGGEISGVVADDALMSRIAYHEGVLNPAPTWAQCHVYPRDFKAGGREIDKMSYASEVICSVGLWQKGGFSMEPVGVWYDHPEAIDDILQLREVLLRNNVPFRDYFSRKDVEAKIRHAEALKKMLPKLEKIALRLD